MLDEYGFEKLDLVVDGLTHEFDVRWKLLPPTDGPPGYPGEPYIPLAVSFAMTSGGRRRQGHLDYALGRSFWEEQRPPVPTEADGETLCRLVLDRLPADLREIDAGADPEALRTNRTPKFLRP
jgi:hypothetical protein